MAKLFGRRKAEQRAPQDLLEVVELLSAMRSGSVWAPLTFTPDSVLSVPAVFACQQFTAGIISQLPFDEYRKTGEGRQPVSESPLILSPSADVAAEDWRFQAVESAQLHGNAIGLIVNRDRLMFPTQVEIVHPKRVEARWAAETRLLEWRIDGDKVPADEIWHMPGRPIVGSPLGVGLVEHMANSAGVGHAARRYIAEWFANGGAPTVVLSPDKDPGPQGAQALLTAVNTALESKGRKPIVLPPNVTTSTWPGSKPADAELVELLRQNATDIAMFYALPAELVGGSSGDSMTYSNAEHRVIELLTFGVSYWLTKLERSLSRSLPRGRFAKANEAAIIRTDIKTRIETMKAEIEAGLMTVNEGRALLDRPPLNNPRQPNTDELPGGE